MKPHVAIVLGTRPEIIKLASVVTEATQVFARVTLIHTNQHYSDSLDSQFFDELELPAPTINLGIGSGRHNVQVGKTLCGLDSALASDPPGAVIVQGDTNSALAGALWAAKAGIPCAHVEAGLRSFDDRMPEELNRRLIDHASTHLFPPTAEAAQHLVREAVRGKVSDPIGNTIADAVLTYGTVSYIPPHGRGPLILLTLHRAENVDNPEVLQSVLDAVGSVAKRHGLHVKFPVHPRTRERIASYSIRVPPVISVEPPVSFGEMLRLQATARLVMTDAGGIQEEACILGTPCVTLRIGTERPETLAVGANAIGGVLPASIAEAADRMLGLRDRRWDHPFGDGRTGRRIVASMARVIDQSPTAPEVVS